MNQHLKIFGVKKIAQKMVFFSLLFSSYDFWGNFPHTNYDYGYDFWETIWMGKFPKKHKDPHHLKSEFCQIFFGSKLKLTGDPKLLCKR